MSVRTPAAAPIRTRQLLAERSLPPMGPIHGTEPRTRTASDRLRSRRPARRADCPSAPRPTTSRPSRRCSAPSSSTTRRTTASRASSSRTTSTIRCTSRSTRRCQADRTSGKQATPITLRTFFENAEPIDADLTVPQYLGRLAANATTIINARDYGRTIHDLATRRAADPDRRGHGQRAPTTAPVDFPPKEQIEEAETRLYSLAETEQVRPGLPRPSTRR